MEMEWYWALATLIGMVMFFMAMGVPVALTFITVNVIGALVFMGVCERMFAWISRKHAQLC